MSSGSVHTATLWNLQHADSHSQMCVSRGQARALVNRSSGPAQTAALAESHAQLARDALRALPESEAREALEGLTWTVLSRTK